VKAIARLLVGALACQIPMANGILPGERDLIAHCQRCRVMCYEIRLDTAPSSSRPLIEPAQRQRDKSSEPLGLDDRSRQSP
jgi:hypothetical protein